jgi:hypothetical protein
MIYILECRCLFIPELRLIILMRKLDLSKRLLSALSTIADWVIN